MLSVFLFFSMSVVSSLFVSVLLWRGWWEGQRECDLHKWTSLWTRRLLLSLWHDHSLSIYILLAATSTPETWNVQSFSLSCCFYTSNRAGLKLKKHQLLLQPLTQLVSTEQDKNKAGKAVSVTVYVLFANTTWRLADNLLNWHCAHASSEK